MRCYIFELLTVIGRSAGNVVLTRMSNWGTKREEIKMVMKWVLDGLLVEENKSFHVEGIK